MPDTELASRKGKERQAPQPTDFAERLVALQRKQAQCVLSPSLTLACTRPHLARLFFLLC